MKHDAAIDVKKLCKSFDNISIVKNIDLLVKRGEVFGFLGPNGSGKTTTIRMLCGLLTPDAGTGFCLGYNIITESANIKQHVGYMTQKFSFYNELSIEENLMFIARMYAISQPKKHIEHILNTMNLLARRKQLTGQLSGGWKQRVALAACLLHDPQLLLLDEPTAGIDPIARREFWDIIHTLSEHGVTSLVSTHYMDEAERCTRLAYLAHGSILISGTVIEIIDQTKILAWRIKLFDHAVGGIAITKVLQQAKLIQGVKQVALIGNQIHICGYDNQLIEAGLSLLAQCMPIKWIKIEPSLEDSFISLGT